MPLGMKEDGFGIADLFASIDGESFSGETEFQGAVIRSFNAHLQNFPPQYNYLDAIAWAVRQGWIVVEGSKISVSLPRHIETEPPLLALAA